MKKFIILFIFTIILSSCENNEEIKIQKTYKTIIVGTGTINSSNNYIGYTKGIEQVSLSTKSPGRITYLSKNIGDVVYKGELLASLDSSESKVGYDTADNITNSLISLKTSTSNALDEQIKAFEARIEGIKLSIKGVNTGLNDTKNITKTQIETAKLGVETAQVNLEKTINSLNTQKENIISSSKSAIIGSVILNENIIYFVDSILGVTKENKSLNDKFQNYIGVKDSNNLNETENIFLETKKIFDEYKLYYETVIENKKPSEEEIIKGLTLAEKLSEKEKVLLKNMYKVINDSIANIYLPIESINNYKNQISTFGIEIENSLLSMSGNTMIGIKGSLQNLSSFESEYDKAVSLLKKQVELAKQTLEQYNFTSNGEVNNIQNKKEITQASLDEAYAGLKSLKAQKQATLGEIDAKIAESYGAKQSAGVMINNGKIYAIFSGIITSKLAEAGQVINAGMPIYEIANTKQIKINIYTSKNIVEQLTKGDKINIQIEGFNDIYTGKISNISSSANTITKKYEIEIIIDNKNGEIPVGAMATVILKNSIDSNFLPKEEEQGQKIIIPNSAIISKFMIPGVYVLEDKKAVFKNIEIIKMGENNSEIKGLNNGEIIITDGKENIWDGEEL